MFSYRKKNQVMRGHKPVQNLDYFRAKTVSPLVAIVVIIGVIATLYVAFQAVQNHSKKKHRIALANFQFEVFNGVVVSDSVPSKTIEDRMRACLPQLEALAHAAPSSDAGMTNRVLASWRTQLSLGDGPLPKSSDAWSRLFLAQRFIALGDATNAAAEIATLRKAANPSETWATFFWYTLMNINQLRGDRSQGWKDLVEYRVRFEQQANQELEGMMASI